MWHPTPGTKLRGTRPPTIGQIITVEEILDDGRYVIRRANGVGQIVPVDMFNTGAWEIA